MIRFSQFSGKEIIDVNQGQKMGVLGQSDLVIHPRTGQIRAIVLPPSRNLSMLSKGEDVVIPWSSIRKIGPDMILVDLKRERGKVREREF